MTSAFGTVPVMSNTHEAANAQPNDKLTCAHCGDWYYAGQVCFQTRWMSLCPTCDGRHWFSKTCPKCGTFPSDLWRVSCAPNTEVSK